MVRMLWRGMTWGDCGSAGRTQSASLVGTWARWKCVQRRSRKEKFWNTWRIDVRTRSRWPVSPATASQGCSLSPVPYQSWSQLLVDFQPCSRPACFLNHPQSAITNAFIGQRPKAWLPTTLLPPCLVACPFLPQLHLFGSFARAAAETEGLCRGTWGDRSQPAPPRAGRAARQTGCDGERTSWAAEQRLQPRGKMPDFSSGRRKGTSSASRGDGAVCCHPEKHP